MRCPEVSRTKLFIHTNTTQASLPSDPPPPQSNPVLIRPQILGQPCAQGEADRVTMAALYKTITLCTPPIIDIGIIQHHAGRHIIFIQAGPYCLHIEPPSVGRDRSRYGQFIKCPHNMLAIPHVCYFVSVPPPANQCVHNKVSTKV